MMNPLDERRVRHVNHLMESINNQASEIYEGLVDKDFEQAESDIDKLILILINIKSSFKDEI
jgi:hypothetical protein|tara:strand:+ start:9884 stop:10069 length:186 start_codon:yes stop_codon:yes gene_type:complete